MIPYHCLLGGLLLTLSLLLDGSLSWAQRPTLPPFARPGGSRPPPPPRDLDVEVMTPLRPPASADGTYYVAPNGHGTACTQAQPCATINAGLARMQRGNTLIIGPGQYQELLTDFAGIGGYTAPIPSGSESQPTVIRAASPGSVTLTPGPVPEGWASLLEFGKSHDIVVDGLRLDGQWALENGLGLAESQRLHFRNMAISQFRGQGGQGSCDGCTFTNVDMHDIARRNGETTCSHSVCAETPGAWCPGYCHGLYLAGQGNVIDGGRYSNIDGYGIHLYPNISDSVVRNVCVHDVGSHGIGLFFGRNNRVERVRVWNNAGVGIWMNTGDSVVSQSHVAGNQGGQVEDGTGTMHLEQTQQGGLLPTATDCRATASPPAQLLATPGGS